jgi:hypothetical protein
MGWQCGLGGEDLYLLTLKNTLCNSDLDKSTTICKAGSWRFSQSLLDLETHVW